MTAAGPVIPNFGQGSSCVTGDHLFCWDWVKEHWGDTLQPALVLHIELTLVAVAVGSLAAFGLAVLAHRRRRAVQPISLVSALIYTFPSIALFQLLVPYTGLSFTTVAIPLVAYTLVILFPQFVAGLDAAPPEVLEAAQRAVLADELGDELVRRMGEDRVGRVVLGEHASRGEDCDAVAHRDRLVDVVGDEDDRLRHLVVQAAELLLEAGARDRVEGAEGLVHQEHRRIGCEGTGEPDALALAA